MKIDLTPVEKAHLEKQHKATRDRRIADRIKAVLLSHEGWSALMIAQALRLRIETIYDHLNEYHKLEKLKPANGGSEGSLNEIQKQELINHLILQTFLKVSAICAYVKETYAIQFTVSGMTKWLKRHGFVYKKPKMTPLKADPILQAAFVEKYESLMLHTPEDEPILFEDGVHPTMATKVTYGWILSGKENNS